MLGITFCDNLKWGQNTKEIGDKACKRLYLQRVLKRAGVPPDHFITIYCSLVRSVLEYACQVWTSSVQSHLEQQLERVQKRALRIIFQEVTMKRHFAEAQPLVFQKEGCAYAIRPLRKHTSPPRPYIRMFPPRRNAVCGCNLRSSHRTSFQRCRTERFKTSFFPAMAFLQ